MAKAGMGSGQGKVRHFKDGVMLQCSNAPCERFTRYFDPEKRGVPSWKCESCTNGRPPFVHKNKGGRVGQQKQSRR